MPATLKVLAALAGLLLGDPVMAEALRLLGVDRSQVGIADDEVEILVTVRFANDSGQPDESPYIIATVPSDARLVEGSATGPGAVVTVLPPLEVHPDGYSSAAFEENPADGARPMGPADHRDAGSARIRWDLPGPMDPGVTGIVSFRIRVPGRNGDRTGVPARQGLPDPTSGPGGVAPSGTAVGSDARDDDHGK